MLASKLFVQGAYSRSAIYCPADVSDVVEYARDRGIRVVPEIDSPGHASSWLVGYPDLDAGDGNLNPTAPATFQLLDELFAAVTAMFHDDFVHIGCDEVDFDILNTSAAVVEYMQTHAIPRTSVGLQSLVARYISKLGVIVRGKNRTAVAWQEAMDHYGPNELMPTAPPPGLPTDMVIQQW